MVEYFCHPTVGDEDGTEDLILSDWHMPPPPRCLAAMSTKPRMTEVDREEITR